MRRPRSRSPQPGPSTPSRSAPRGRPLQDNRDGRSYKRGRGLAPLRSPSPLPLVNSRRVRFGAIAWSSGEERLRRELRTTAKCAWDETPGGMDAAQGVELDPQDPLYVLITFATQVAANAFIQAWIHNKHKVPQLSKARAEIV